MINRRFKNTGDVDYALNKVLQVRNYLFMKISYVIDFYVFLMFCKN